MFSCAGTVFMLLHTSWNGFQLKNTLKTVILHICACKNRNFHQNIDYVKDFSVILLQNDFRYLVHQYYVATAIVNVLVCTVRNCTFLSEDTIFGLTSRYLDTLFDSTHKPPKIFN